jgi:hypothetical protein
MTSTANTANGSIIQNIPPLVPLTFAQVTALGTTSINTISTGGSQQQVSWSMINTPQPTTQQYVPIYHSLNRSDSPFAAPPQPIVQQVAPTPNSAVLPPQATSRQYAPVAHNPVNMDSTIMMPPQMTVHQTTYNPVSTVNSDVFRPPVLSTIPSYNTYQTNVITQPIMAPSQNLYQPYPQSMPNPSLPNLTYQSALNGEPAQMLPRICEAIQLLTHAQMHGNDKDKALKPKGFKVKQFDGTIILDYIGFKPSVQRTLDNTCWRPLEKFLYLRECLVGNAFNLIAHLQVTDSSYEIAWRILDEAYNQPRLMIDACTQMIWNPNFVTRANDRASKQNFHNTFEQVRGNFEVLQVTRDQLLAQFVLNRLDIETARDFENFIGFTRETPSIQQIHKFLIHENAVAAHQAIMDGKNTRNTQLNSQNLHSIITFNKPH